MYDKEAGVVACDECDLTIEGYGFSIGEGNKEPSGCYCWECACERMEFQTAYPDKDFISIFGRNYLYD